MHYDDPGHARQTLFDTVDEHAKGFMRLADDHDDIMTLETGEVAKPHRRGWWSHDVNSGSATTRTTW